MSGDAYLGLRVEYAHAQLSEADLHPDPIIQLQKWISEALAADVVEPNAACFATADSEGTPNARTLLCRAVDARGLTFYSNRESAKGQELAQNPRACVNFWWGELERQVRIKGRVEIIQDAESDAYFASRPIGSQAASSLSPQSQILVDRESLDAAIQEKIAETQGPIPRPSHWGGYRLIPHYFEFWQGRPARVHDRLVYQLENGSWRVFRLAP